MSAFIDAGAVYDPQASNANAQIPQYKSLGQSIRFAGGTSLLWVSPFGPLKFSVGVPIGRKPGDQRQIMQFTFGGVF